MGALGLVALLSALGASGEARTVQGDAADVDDPSEAAKEMSDIGAGSLPSVDLMIVVPSHSTHEADTRAAIRESWGQYLNKTAVNCTLCERHDVKLLFVVGEEGNETEIASEVDDFKDLGVLEDFSQPEHGGDAEMTQRTIRYAVEHFKFKLLLKVNTQSWVFMDRLLKFLEEDGLFEINASEPGYYVGNFAGPPTPALRDDASLDETYFASTGSKIYPMYAKGGGFLLSPDLCEYISGMGAASEDTSGAPKWGAEYGWAPVPRLMSLGRDDVSVGLWLLPVNHTKVQMPVGIGNEGCSGFHSSSLIIDHHVDADGMRDRWRNFMETGNICAAQAAQKANASFLRRGRVGGLVAEPF